MSDTVNGNVATGEQVGQVDKGRGQEQVQAAAPIEQINTQNGVADPSAMETSPIEDSHSGKSAAEIIADAVSTIAGETENTNEVEVQKEIETTTEEDQTKEGKPAEVGEKRVRTEGEEEQTGEITVAEGGEKTVDGAEAKKVKLDEGEAAPAPTEEAAAEEEATAAPAKKTRGRKASTKSGSVKKAPAAATTSTEAKKRGPGRPRKNPPPEPATTETTTNIAEESVPIN